MNTYVRLKGYSRHAVGDRNMRKVMAKKKRLSRDTKREIPFSEIIMMVVIVLALVEIGSVLGDKVVKKFEVPEKRLHRPETKPLLF